MATANQATRNAPANVRPEDKASETKKPGRPAKPDSEKKTSQTGKSIYPGCADGKKLSTSETPDWNAEAHKRLRAANFTTKEIFDAWKAAHPQDRNYFSLLCDEAGDYDNEKQIPADADLSGLSVVADFTFSENGKKLVGLKGSQFADRRSLAKLLAKVCEAKLATLNKLASLTDEQIAKQEKKDNLVSAMSRASNKNGTQVSKDQLEAAISMLPMEMQIALGYAEAAK